MSDVSNPKPKKGDRIESDHKNLNEPYTSSSKHKFEGWPILWILLILCVVFAILWLTGTTPSLLKWIRDK